MTEPITAIVQSQEVFLAPAATLAELKTRYGMFTQFVKDILRSGIDYAIIPGSAKPSLVKPGAEKLMTLFGLTARFERVNATEDWSGVEHGGEPFFNYDYRCNLFKGERLVGSCDGSCNSWEKKYRYRQGQRKCPKCGKEAIIAGKAEYGGGFICFTKKGGCGAKYKADDPAITSQQVGQVRNEDIFDQVNTLQKMAQKRAFVGAVLIVTNASEYFTQDIEDMPGFIDAEFVPADPPPSPAPKPEPVAQPSMDMSLETAEAVTNKDGTRYGDISTDKLTYMANALAKSLKDNHLEPDDRSTKLNKQDAIRVILAHRAEVKE